MPQDLLARINDALDRYSLGNFPIGYAASLLADAAAYLATEADRRGREASETDEARIVAALDALSYTEEQGLVALFSALPDEGGLIIASQIADRQRLTRSTIVNALRKLESAGLLHCQSLGMKGTHIKFLFPGLRERALAHLRPQRAARSAT